MDNLAKDDTKKQTNKINKIRSDFLDRISVAGWRETFSEPILWIRRTFQVTLSVLFVCCLYNVYCQVRACLLGGYKDKISDIIVESLPFSNVTICAQVYFNQTFLRENVIIPEDVRDNFKNQDDFEEFFEQLTLFLSLITRPRKFSAYFVALFGRVLKKNPQFIDYSKFAQNASPTCESMFKRCWFDGMEFECCARAVFSMDDDGICFLLALNFDSDNAVPAPGTLYQRRPGPAGGLTVEVSLPTNDFPWLEDDAQNGYRIIVSPTPYSCYSSPLTAPHAAETFIKVTPSRRSLVSNCIGYNHLATLTPPGGHYVYYDPEGSSCGLRGMMEMMKKYTSCVPATYYLWPNSTAVCKPMENYAISIFATTDDLDAAVTDMSPTALGVTNAKITNFLQMFENDVKHALSEKALCPKHCHFWTYSSSTSFIDLEKNKPQIQIDQDINAKFGNSVSQNRGRNPQTNKSMYSRIHVYYAEFGYRQHVQTEEITWHLAFYAFCNIFILYLGMSVVSFFHLMFYIPRYLHMLWKSRVYGPAKRKIRVGPKEILRMPTMIVRDL